MPIENYGLFGETNYSASMRESLSKYLAKWPVFLFFLLLSVGGGFLYICFTVPKYIATTTFLIKGIEIGEKNNDDLIESAMNGKRQINLNNEILLIGSSHLMERTVSKNGFNISHFKEERLLNKDIYIDAPFNLAVQNITDSNRTYNIHIKNMNATGGSYSVDKIKNKESQEFKWNKPFTVSGQSFILTTKEKNPDTRREIYCPMAAGKGCRGRIIKVF